jgi:hypothetical protein
VVVREGQIVSGSRFVVRSRKKREGQNLRGWDCAIHSESLPVIPQDKAEGTARDDFLWETLEDLLALFLKVKSYDPRRERLPPFANGAKDGAPFKKSECPHRSRVRPDHDALRRDAKVLRGSEKKCATRPSPILEYKKVTGAAA